MGISRDDDGGVNPGRGKGMSKDLEGIVKEAKKERPVAPITNQDQLEDASLKQKVAEVIQAIEKEVPSLTTLALPERPKVKSELNRWDYVRIGLKALVNFTRWGGDESYRELVQAEEDKLLLDRSQAHYKWLLNSKALVENSVKTMRDSYQRIADFREQVVVFMHLIDDTLKAQEGQIRIISEQNQKIKDRIDQVSEGANIEQISKVRDERHATYQNMMSNYKRISQLVQEITYLQYVRSLVSPAQKDAKDNLESLEVAVGVASMRLQEFKLKIHIYNNLTKNQAIAAGALKALILTGGLSEDVDDTMQKINDLMTRNAKRYGLDNLSGYDLENFAQRPLIGLPSGSDDENKG